MKKKRHIGNDFVHVVFKECDEDYDLRTISGQFNDVHIVIQPLNDHEYRTQLQVTIKGCPDIVAIPKGEAMSDCAQG
uniref:Rap-GAP domain-containing protein n=1 Tax=Hyaloperonospora arabidopsidis (strain Emoy2) TaxID=559515 RepID=M4C278_HYAAE